jgi:hypothetical protein
MDCETAKGLLSSYYDEELDPAGLKLVAAHVAACSACSHELELLAKLDRDSRLLYVPEPPPEIWHGVERHLAVRRTAAEAIGNSFSRRQFLAATGTVALASLGVYVTSTFGRRPPKAGAPNIVQSAQPVSIAPNVVLADLSYLPPEERQQVEFQRFCANDLCHERLGIGGEPIKVVLKNRMVVYVCCHECELYVRAHPSEALAKVQELSYRRSRRIQILGPSH